MKRTIFYIISLFFLTSCYPPKIIYSIEEIKPSYKEDSIRVQLLEGNTISPGTTIIYLGLHLEISNDRKDDVSIGQNSTLELRTDSSNLQYTILQDSTICQIDRNKTKTLCLNFQAIDYDHITYKTVKWPPLWSFKLQKVINSGHKLFLFLDVKNHEGKKMEKCVVFKPTGTKKM